MLNINVPRLQFEAESIVAWIKANPCNPRALTSANLPVELLGEGNYGVAYRLLNFPGMVLKLCWDPEDAYPLYVRAVLALGAAAKSWMPDVYALGGDEVNGTFWCVTKEYRDPCKGVPHWSDSNPEWVAFGGDQIQNAVNRTNPRSWLVDPIDPTWQQFADEYAEFMRPFVGLVQSFMHPGNALLDGDQFKITDPWSSSHNKAEVHQILRNLQCPSAQVVAASQPSAPNSAPSQQPSLSVMQSWNGKRSLKHGELSCLAVSVPITKSRVQSPGFSSNLHFRFNRFDLTDFDTDTF